MRMIVQFFVRIIELSRYIFELLHSLKWVLFEKKDFQTNRDIERRDILNQLSAIIKQLL